MIEPLFWAPPAAKMKGTATLVCLCCGEYYGGRMETAHYFELGGHGEVTS